MTLKKRIYIFSVILLSMIFLTSCGKIKLIDKEKTFCEKLEKYDINPEIRKQTVFLDLRITGDENSTKETYAAYHFNGAVNYNYRNGSKEEFIYWFTTRYNTNYTVFLFDDGDGAVAEVKDILKEEGYKEIYGFTKGYEKLRKSDEYTKRFVETKGLEGCDC